MNYFQIWSWLQSVNVGRSEKAVEPNTVINKGHINNLKLYLPANQPHSFHHFIPFVFIKSIQNQFLARIKLLSKSNCLTIQQYFNTYKDVYFDLVYYNKCEFEKAIINELFNKWKLLEIKLHNLNKYYNIP